MPLLGLNYSCRVPTIYFGKGVLFWKVPLTNLDMIGSFPICPPFSIEVYADKAERAVLIALYPKPASNNSIKKSTIKTTVVHNGSVFRFLQNKFHFSMYP